MLQISSKVIIHNLSAGAALAVISAEEMKKRLNIACLTVDSVKTVDYTSLLGDHSEREPPDPIPNSEVKPLSADDSVAVCHAKVGNCQAPNIRNLLLY